MKVFMPNRDANPDSGIAEALRAVYAEPALVPASPWLGGKPSAPRLALDRGNAGLVARVAPVGEPVRLFVVRSLAGGKWTTRIVPAAGDKPVEGPLVDAADTVQVT